MPSEVYQLVVGIGLVAGFVAVMRWLLKDISNLQALIEHSRWLRSQNVSIEQYERYMREMKDALK